MPPPPPVDVGSCARAAVDDWVMRGLPEGPRLLGEDSPLGDGRVWSVLRMLLLSREINEESVCTIIFQMTALSTSIASYFKSRPCTTTARVYSIMCRTNVQDPKLLEHFFSAPA